MEVFVDASACQGHARCNLICPEVFDLDDNGYAAVIDKHVPPEHEAAVQDAVSNCPERAISVT